MRDRQRVINVSEVFYIWEVMVTKLDLLETIQLYENFIDKFDLKIINAKVKDDIIQGIEDMEKLMKEYALPFPERPPAMVNATVNLEQLTEKAIFQGLYESIQAFYFILASGFMNSLTPEVRHAMKDHLIRTMEIQDILVEYGKLKGLINEPPMYRP